MGSEPLSHGYGVPLRLMVPNRREFQRVKGVVHVELWTTPSHDELIAIHTSSFTPEKRGERYEIYVQPPELSTMVLDISNTDLVRKFLIARVASF